MAYSQLAQALRRCRATRKDGEPCRAFAVWDDPRGLCAAHGRHHTGPLPREYAPRKRASYPPCTCPAYQFGHRPGGGLCRWPDVPAYRLTTPAGTKSELNGERGIFGLGRRLNHQRWEKMLHQPPEAAEESHLPPPRPIPYPEPQLTHEEELVLV